MTDIAARAAAMVDEEAIESLGERGWFVREWLTAEEVAAARAALDAVLEAGGLREAGISRGAGLRVDRALRSDLMAWLEPAEAPEALLPLLRGFDALRDALNERAWLGLERYEIQAACYPGEGARYARHRDAFPGPDNRRVTAVVYLNPDWGPEHGGELRLFDDSAGAEEATDVAPSGGRCIVFLADRVEHEVLASYARRYAVTAWYYRRGAVTGGLRV